VLHHLVAANMQPIKDAFLRAEKAKVTKSGASASIMKSYVCEQQLQFLKTSMEKRSTSGNMNDAKY